MKPVAFDLQQARTVEEAVDLLSGGRDAKVLAGGQSLVPLLNFRLARPALLVDVDRLEALRYVRDVAGVLAIGALTRQRTLERSEVVARVAPLVAEVLPLIAHPAIRNRGTVGGSLAHGDAAAELCVVTLALDGVMVVQGRGGRREIASRDFFLGPLTTALAPDEVLTEVRLPVLPPRTGTAFEEVARRRGDFALVGVAAILTRGDDGAIADARLAYASMGPTPLRARSAEAALCGAAGNTTTFATAAEAALAELDPGDDIHADAGYRRHVAAALARRALRRAWERAA